MVKPKSPQEIFKNIDFSNAHKLRKEFEYCEFSACIFPDLSNYIFRDCVFVNCNLSNFKTTQSILQNCAFKDCKLLGTNFSGAKDFAFEIHFENCILDYASFDKKPLNTSSFKNSKIHHANFTQADLSKCSVSNCDFFEALFSGTNLSGLDLSTSINFIIDPGLNKIKKAKFLLRSLPGLLQSYDIIVES
jgi:uncharacterized protein YjbI with pentapeptide repeats